jgi:hypothetical protein
MRLEGEAMTAAEKIVDNAALQAVSRISMILTPVLIMIVGALFSIWINGIADDASAAAATSVTLQVRVKTLEDSQVTGRIESNRYQDQLIGTLADVNRSLIEQGKQIAALTATIEALKQRGRQ